MDSMENLIHLPIYQNVVKRYGKYIKKVNGELVKVTYDWFERENKSHYKLCLTKQQYDQMQASVAPIDSQNEKMTFDQFCDILIPVLTVHENDQHDDYAIWLAFCSFDQNHDKYIQANELENFIKIIGKSVDRNEIKDLISKVDWDHNNQLDYNEFRQFIIRGYARQLLMIDITQDLIYSNDQITIPEN